MVGVASVEKQKRGAQQNYCKMDILYVDNQYKRHGIGSQLLAACKKEAKIFGAEKLYISATPTKNTVDFYLRRGARLVVELDQVLFAKEPEDIHLELDI
ncbi:MULTISPECIES: GNAT family N-acetyltransferase [unclassified Pedobacter]|uniref:GNAT family N-acetyltransferase n=1 Tax=unclassified Pedobacter TaxID=2628915 RepID=UPI00293BD423|nr:GNAT family N-acetyltransferase [Pedobacter sp. SG918]